MRCLCKSLIKRALFAGCALLALAPQAAPAADYQIAFRQTGGEPYPIVVMEADGSNQTVVYEGPGPPAVSWSPDGKSLAFLDYQQGILRIDGIDQGTFNPVAAVVVPGEGECFDKAGTPYPYTFIGNPRWSTVADEIAFTAAGDGGEVLCVAPAVYDPEVFPEAVVTDGNFMGWRLTWNADGTQIAFMDDANLKIVERATGSIVASFGPPVIDGQVDDTWFNLDWARNGDPRIAFQTSGDSKNTWIYTIDTAKGEFSDKLVFGNHPSWSPDNLQLAFNNPKGGGGWGRLSLFTFATGQVEDLTSGGGGRPDWRPPAPQVCGDGTCAGYEDQCSCSSDCGEPPFTEDACSDAIDNDCDGFVDCGDIDCDSEPECLEPICGDGTCAGYEDQCNCSNDCGEPLFTEDACSDLVDNDCDLSTDCDDSDCFAASVCQCLAKGVGCTSNDQCCSRLCHPVKGTCK